MRDGSLQDIRYALRGMVGRPSFAVVAILSLSIGIGAVTSVFSVVNAVIFKSLPYHNPDELVMVWKIGQGGSRKFGTSAGVFLDWQSRNQVFTGLAAFADSGNLKYDLTGNGIPERVSGVQVSTNLFDLLGTSPAFGRLFMHDDQELGRNRVVILTYGLWQRHFGADRNIVGADIILNGQSYTVVGVMPASFKVSYAHTTDLFLPLTFNANELRARGSVSYQVVARLKPGVSLEQAQQATNALSAELEQEHPETDQRNDTVLAPMCEEVIGDFRRPLMMLLGAAVVVLLMACVNTANLFLVRNIERSKEIAIRTVLGASRFRLLRQLVIESLLLSLISCGLGLLLAEWLIGILGATIPTTLPRGNEVTLDTKVFIFSLSASIIAGISVGLFPALAFWNGHVGDALKEVGTSVTSGGTTRRLRSALVVIEFALAFILLFGTALLSRTLWHLMHVDLGFSPENVLVLQVTLPESKYQSQEQRRSFFDDLLNRIESFPGVQKACITSTIPLRGPDYMTRVEISGQQPKSSSDTERLVRLRAVDGRFFEVMHIRLRTGEVFNNRQIYADSNTGLVSESLAQSLFNGTDPIGSIVMIRSRQLRIIGVVDDIVSRQLTGPVEPALYVPAAYNPDNRFWVAVRTESDPLKTAPLVQQEVREIDKDRPIESLTTLESIVSDATSYTRFYILVLGTFACVAVLLAAIGIHGVTSFAVVQRTREIGIRMAIGAKPADIIKMVLRGAMIHSLAGLSIGLAASLATSRVIRSLLYGVAPTDPTAFFAVSFLLVVITVVSAVAPAAKASRINAVDALRTE